LNDLNKDTIDKHDEGIWAGWVYQSIIDGENGSAA